MTRLFSEWSHPGVIIRTVVYRFLTNVGLTALIVDTTGHSTLAEVGVALTLVSSALMVLVLQRTIPDRYSLLEVVLQLCLLVLTIVVVALNPSLVRVGGVVFVGVGVLIGLVLSIVTYGELSAP